MLVSSERIPLIVESSVTKIKAFSVSHGFAGEEGEVYILISSCVRRAENHCIAGATCKMAPHPKKS